MTLLATEAFSGGFVRDPVGRLVTVASAGGALAAGEQMSGGFVRDADGRLMTIASTGGVLTGSEQMSGGFVRDPVGRLVISSGAAVGWGGGFIRDQAGRLCTSTASGALGAGEAYSGGFVRDVNGLLSLAGGSLSLALTQVASDNFNRANGNVGGANNWLNSSDPTMTIVSNEASGTGAQIAGNYRSETYGSDQYSQCTVGTVANVSTDFIGLTLRHNAATNAEYACLYFDNGGTPEMDIYFRLASGAYTKIASAVVSACVTGDVLTAFVIGTQIVFQRNGVGMISVADAQISGGAPGITSFGTMTLDNWQGGNAAMSGALGATIATDNFNRANGTVSSGQPNWTAVTVAFSGVNSIDATIVSNEVNASGANHETDQRNEAFSNDQWARIAVGSVALAVSAGFVGTIVRWNGATGYMGCIFGADLSYRIYKIIAGSASVQLALCASGLASMVTGTTVTLVVKGTRVSLLINGVEVAFAIDATVTTGQPGLQEFPPSTADNFTAGNA